MPKKKNEELFTTSQMSYGGKIVKFIRVKLMKMNMAEFSRFTKIDRTMLIKVEAGKVNPSVGLIMRIVDATPYKLKISFVPKENKKWVAGDEMLKE